MLSTGATVDSGEKDNNDDGEVKEEIESSVKESSFDCSKLPPSQEFKPEQTEVSALTVILL